MKRLRWLFFIAALLLLLTTPAAVYLAINLGRSDRKLIPIALVAFAIRFGIMCWFTKLWWNYRSRPTNSSPL